MTACPPEILARQHGAGILSPLLAGELEEEWRNAETSGLVRALGLDELFHQTMRIRNPSSANLFGSGQVEALAGLVAEHHPEVLVIDAATRPAQQRNLERRLKTKILDRTGLILEIFALGANSADGRLQVEMARLVYERSRLVRTWTHLERQRGGLGFVAGPGESQLESDRRLLDGRIARYRRQLKNLRRTRQLQRQRRKRRGLPVIALAGYTNAGKSTLFNRLAGASVTVADMPFATLDPTIREIALPSGRHCALIDTVGFISDLPACLIAAFHATIEQIMEADLLLHVRDISHPCSDQQNQKLKSVWQALEQKTGLPMPIMVEAWNKADSLSHERMSALAGRTKSDKVLISALSGDAMPALLEALEQALYPSQRSWQIVLDKADGKKRAQIHQTALVVHEECHGDGSIHIEILATPEEYDRLAADARLSGGGGGYSKPRS